MPVSEVHQPRTVVVELENYNPENRGVFTINHMISDFRILFRASYYDDWVDANFSSDDPDYTCLASTDYHDRLRRQ